MSQADFSFEDLVRAYLAFRASKRNTPAALQFEQHLERNLYDLFEELRAGTYKPGPSICFVITRPRPREVWAALPRDRVVHHLARGTAPARPRGRRPGREVRAAARRRLGRDPAGNQGTALMPRLDTNSLNVVEHRLFIAHQAGMDIMWDIVRPAMLASEELAKDLPGFAGVCLKVGAVAGAAAHARLVMQHLRSTGVI